MHTLTRTVRFSLNPADDPGASLPAVNGFGGSPAMHGLGRYYELHIACQGEPDPVTGYLLNIKEIDAAVRNAALPIIALACREAPQSDPAMLMPRIIAALSQRLGELLVSARWNLTPYYSIEMTADTSHALLRQSFDFSAAHRLHVPALSDDENFRAFGLCNNPSGHGHNYRVEPCVALRLDPAPIFSLTDLEALVHEHVIKPYDHTHLNENTKEFAAALGVNPTVENIARVCFERLRAPIESRSNGSATLRAVTVWETDRTSSTYPA
jgi:6-pyruvoyltetrahydropterin/6-carboxytetrahydropterin synthase